MREAQRRDGSVILFDEDNDQDVVTVEPCVTAFIPISGNACCACGEPLQSWGWRCVAADYVELECSRCHRVHGHLRLGTNVYR